MLAPPLYRQLKNGTTTSHVDCAVETIRMGIGYGTQRKWVPTVAQIRSAAGNPDKGLTMAQWQRALVWAHGEAKRRGHPYEFEMLRPAVSMATLRERLDEGWFAGVAVEYRIINEQFPEGSGQRTLNYRTVNGVKTAIYHALGLWRLYRKGGTNRTVVYDPLYDGRTKAWGTAPNAPVEDAPLPVYRDAMAGYAGSGLVLGFLAKPPPPAPQPEPQPQPQPQPEPQPQPAPPPAEETAKRMQAALDLIARHEQAAEGRRIADKELEAAFDKWRIGSE